MKGRVMTGRAHAGSRAEQDSGFSARRRNGRDPPARQLREHDSRSCNRHVGPGFPVGYQVSGEKCWDGACDLIYATDGSVINWIRDGQLARIGTVIVDEAHERSENIDIVLTQLREQVRQHEHLRVIITSATLDEAFFVSFFGEDNVFQLSIPAKKSFGYGVPLFVGAKIDASTIRDGMTIPAAPSPIPFMGWASEGPVGLDGKLEDLQDTTRKLEKLRCVDEIPVNEWARGDRMPQAVVNQVVAIGKGTDHGDILAFLPTSRVIGWTVKQIEDRLAGLASRVTRFCGPRAATEIEPLTTNTNLR